MIELMVKLTRLERPNPPPPLLPSPANPSLPPRPNPVSSTTLTTPNPPSPSFTCGCLPKLEIPLFAGDGVLSWLFQVKHFFTFHQVLPEQKIDIAAFYMTGEALQRYHWLYSTHQLSSWEEFALKAKLRFGPSSFINHETLLFKLKQRSTFTAYLSEFECLSTRVTSLPTTRLLNFFLSGL